MDMSQENQDPAHPDPNATGASSELIGGQPGVPGREAEEREAAWRRGQVSARTRGASSPKASDGQTSYPPRGMTMSMFAALADSVRDYAVFLLDADGIITYWGEGARLMKWWTRDEVEGAHLRLMYLDGGSEDGTAEEHLQEVGRPPFGVDTSRE
jgi:PAS domain-containing protein